MNIFVCIKQVPDTETKIKLAGDGSTIDSAGIKWIMSSYDEIAVEEALRTKEAQGGTVTVVSAGPARVVDTIRTALAMGADSGIHIELDENADHSMVAKSLAAAMTQLEPSIVYTGKEAIDDGAAQVSQMLAENLSIPAITVALEAKIEGQEIKAKREVEGGSFEQIEATLPVVVAVQKGMNEPRYASLPNIMKAKKKEVKALKAADLGVGEDQRRVKITGLELPAPKPAGRKLSGEIPAQVSELVQLLHNDLKVI